MSLSVIYFAIVIITNFLQVHCHSSDYLSYGPFGFRPNYARALRGALLTEMEIPTTTNKPNPHKPDLHADEWSNSHVGFHLGHDIESRSYDGEDNIISEIANSLFKEPASNDDLILDLFYKNGPWITVPFFLQESLAVMRPESTTQAPTSQRRTPPTTTPFILLPVTETGDYYNPLFRPIYAKAPPPPRSHFLKKLQKTLMKKPSVDLFYYTAATSPATTKITAMPNVEKSTSFTTLPTTATTSAPLQTIETVSMIPVSIKITALPVTNKPDLANSNNLDANYGALENELVTVTAQSATPDTAVSASNRPETTLTTSTMVSFQGKLDTHEPVDAFITSVVPVDTTETSTDAAESYTETTTTSTPVYTWKPVFAERIGKIMLPDVGVTQSTYTVAPSAPEKLHRKRFNSLLDLSMRRGTKRT